MISNWSCGESQLLNLGMGKAVGGDTGGGRDRRK